MNAYIAGVLVLPGPLAFRQALSNSRYMLGKWQHDRIFVMLHMGVVEVMAEAIAPAAHEVVLMPMGRLRESCKADWCKMSLIEEVILCEGRLSFCIG